MHRQVERSGSLPAVSCVRAGAALEKTANGIGTVRANRAVQRRGAGTITYELACGIDSSASQCSSSITALCFEGFHMPAFGRASHA